MGFYATDGSILEKLITFGLTGAGFARVRVEAIVMRIRWKQMGLVRVRLTLQLLRFEIPWAIGSLKNHFFDAGYSW